MWKFDETDYMKRVLSPAVAVAWAAFFNFIAFLFFVLHVAETVGKGIVDPLIVDAGVIFGALMGAIVWNVITWWLGIPSSSSHALIGGLLGDGISKRKIQAQPVVKGDRSLLEKVASADSSDRVDVEQAFVAGTEPQEYCSGHEDDYGSSSSDGWRTR